MDLVPSLLDPHHLSWLLFWQQPWYEMEPSWAAELPNAYQHSWKQIDPTVIRYHLSLDSESPCVPENMLLRWLTMGEVKRKQALYLIGEVIVRGSGHRYLHDDDVSWCRHLAKALMPGYWAIAKERELTSEQMGLIVTRQWMPSSTWQRARLLYTKSLFESIENVIPEPIPDQRLNQLWHSVIWRLTEVTNPDDNDCK